MCDSAEIVATIRRCLPAEAEFNAEQSFAEAGMDSLRLFHLALEIESLLGRELKDDEIESVLMSRTLREVVAAFENFEKQPIAHLSTSR